MSKKNISILYKTLSGNPAVRWAQENEYSRFEHETPAVSDSFKELFLEPDENWLPDDEPMINQLLGQQFQNPPYFSLDNFLSRSNVESPQRPSVRQLLFHPDKDKGEIIREPFDQEKQGNLFRQLSESAQKAKSQKSNPQQPLSEDQLNLINHGLRYQSNLPGQEWLPEELTGDAIPNSGYAPYNLPKGRNPQREEEIKEESSFLENSEGTPYSKRGDIESQEKIMERWLSNHRSEADKRRLLSSPSPFHEGNGRVGYNPEPSEQGIENLYDRENSNLPSELYNRIDQIIKGLRGDPKVNHLLSEIEKGGKIAFIMDAEAKNPYYHRGIECIVIPSDWQSRDLDTPIFEEIIHRGQHLIPPC